ncbi:MAG: hypothetical protein PHE89_06455 [Alphaproteobacteria bacterium]|nr:hypothetical protein [Alphaproteobacteria bacterium]
MLIAFLGIALTQTSCTVQQLGRANQSMQIYERYEANARVWQSRNPKRLSSTGARIIKSGNIVSSIEWDNALLRGENGYVVLYKRAKNGWLVVRKFHPRSGGSYSFDGITRYGTDDVKVVATAGRIDVYMNRESHRMR